MNDLISKQAAIDAIKKYYLSFDAIDANFLDGLYTAIKLIKENVPSAQPNTRNTLQHVESVGCVGDTISRQAAINEIAKWMLEYGGEKEKRERDALENVANGIKKLPSVQPRKGKWAGTGYSERFGIFICDNCGKFATMKSEFCPNCGADMRGSQDE